MAAAVPIASIPASDSTSAPFPTLKSTASTFKSSSPALKPNPHPYAIKTSSTGALARSNSSSAAASVKHHYVPSPSPRSPERPESRSEYRGHRYSTSISGSSDRLQLSPTRSERSLSEDSASSVESSGPPPLPSPGPRRSKRAETLPTVDTATAANIAAFAAGVTAQSSIEDLPSNPKLWTPAQLSAYLVRALRVRAGSGEAAVAAPVAKDIAAWVRAQSITGRVFLRWTEEDLELLGTNILWRTALLSASRNLRQNVIRGRIWGPPSPPADSPFQPSSSTESLNANDTCSSPGTKLRRRNAGRVKGLVSRWESGSESESELPESISSFTSFHPHPQSAPASRTAFTGIEEDPAPWPSSAVGEGEEPTMEELLAAGEDKKGSWGARAWEAMDVTGVQETVRRLDADKDLPPPPPYASPEEKAEGWDTIVPRRDGSGSGSSSGGSGFAGSVKRIRGSGGTHSGRAGKKDSRRIVTAVFLPEAQAAAAENVAEAQGVIVEDVVKVDNAVEDARIAVLEAEVADSRAMLAALRTRLEAVEGRVAAMVAEDSIRVDVQTQVEKIVQRSEDREKEKAGALEPYAIGDIPSYVVLVGLGVCAVVLRVVMQRVALGRRP